MNLKLKDSWKNIISPGFHQKAFPHFFSQRIQGLLILMGFLIGFSKKKQLHIMEMSEM